MNEWRRLEKTISWASLCLILISMPITSGMCSQQPFAPGVEARLPVTAIDFSGTTSIVSITSWWICGPFVVDDRDQKYSPGSETEMLEKDYLAADGVSEVPLKLPSEITNVPINFQRDPVHEPHTATKTGVFLNQVQAFPTPDVNSQFLVWGGYHVFKVMYAAAELESPTDQDVVLLSSTNSPIKIWINDAMQLQSAPGSVGAEDDTHVGAKVHLRAGRNSVLVKMVCFPYRNDFGVWFATLDQARQFIIEHGGVADVLTQIIGPQGAHFRLTPLIDVFGGSPGGEGRYEIRDIEGRVVATRSPVTSDPVVDTSSLPEGLYSVNLEKGALANGELFYIGDVKRRLMQFSAQCASNPAGDLPCAALPKLTELSQSATASFRLREEKLIMCLLSQFEWALRGISLRQVIPDNTPRVRLVSFRSKIDGSTQLYYLHVPPDIQSGQPLAMVVVFPFNDHPGPFFDSPPTTTYLALLRYARFADQYHLSFIAPYGRGQLMPSALAEQDVLEAVEDAKKRFPVDESRIYLTGECAAGRSAFLMAEDHPEIFSAISTLSAWTGELAAITNPQWNSANPLLRLQNLSATPIRLIHGQGDYHSPAPQASLLLQEARKAGVSPEMMWLPGNCKFGLIDPQRAMFEFFATLKRREPYIPRHISLAVTEMEHNHAFWLQVNQLRKTGSPGYVTADIDSRNRIKIAATNVQRASVDTRNLSPGDSKRQRWVVVCNGGRKQRLKADPSKHLVLNFSQDSQDPQRRAKGLTN